MRDQLKMCRLIQVLWLQVHLTKVIGCIMCLLVIRHSTYKDLHINFKEVLAIYFAALRWAHCWSSKHIIIYTDSKAAMHIINKGSTLNPIVMDALRHMFWLSALFNFKLMARNISGQCNIIADAISGIHEFKYLMYFYHILQGLYPHSLLHNTPSGRHVPLLSFLFLAFRFQGH